MIRKGKDLDIEVKNQKKKCLVTYIYILKRDICFKYGQLNHSTNNDIMNISVLILLDLWKYFFFIAVIN